MATSKKERPFNNCNHTVLEHRKLDMRKMPCLETKMRYAKPELLFWIEYFRTATGTWEKLGAFNNKERARVEASIARKTLPGVSVRVREVKLKKENSNENENGMSC